MKGNCAGDLCSVPLFPFDVLQEEEGCCVPERSIPDDEKACLKDALIELQSSLNSQLYGNSVLSCHGMPPLWT